MARVTAPARPAPRARRALTLLIVLVVGLLALSGCARVRAALAVQPDDTVRGEIVVATPETGPDDPGPPITVPPSLEDSVDVAEYRQEGYAGSLVRFDELQFTELTELLAAAGEPGQRVDLTLRRAGNRVVLDGRVDLTTADIDRADFQLRISFPGQVLDTNGDADAGTIGWVFEAGEVDDMEAVVAFDDPQAPSPLNWSVGLATVVLLAAGAVVALARRTRNPPLARPGRR